MAWYDSALSFGKKALNANMSVFGIPLLGKAYKDLTGVTSQEKANDINQANNVWNQNMTQSQFDYQKQLNQNQIQWQADDARKAGINPIAMQGGNLSGFSGTAGNTPLQGTGDSSALLSSILGFALQNKQIQAQKDIAESQNRTAVRTAEISADASNYSAELSFDANSNFLRSQEKISQARNAFEGFQAGLNRAAQKQLQRDALQMQKQIQDSINSISYINNKNTNATSISNKEVDKQIQEMITSLDKYKFEYINSNQSDTFNLYKTQVIETMNLAREQFNEAVRHNNATEAADILRGLGEVIDGLNPAKPSIKLK